MKVKMRMKTHEAADKMEPRNVLLGDKGFVLAEGWLFVCIEHAKLW